MTDASKKFNLIRSLICMLPVPNRDTLELILKLLDKLRQHAQPVLGADGQQIGGNKMDSFNLAMVFGPNLLKKHTNNATSTSSKSSASNSSASSSHHHHDVMSGADKFNLIDDIDAVISVTKYLIENNSSKQA